MDKIDLDEEEARLREKPKLAKDAPKGAEIENAWKIDGHSDQSDDEAPKPSTAVSARQSPDQKKDGVKKKVVKEKPKEEEDRNLDPIFDKPPKKTEKELLQEKYMSLPVKERIDFMKEHHKNLLVSKFAEGTLRKADALNREVQNLSAGQQSIAMGTFAKIRETQLNRKLFAIRDVQRVTD